MRGVGLSGIAVLFVVGSCLPEAPPPQGEALIVVDTDAPAPVFVGRMRLDVYASDGTWIESRDTPAHTNDDWPLSFSVFTPEGTGVHDALLRIRLYPEGETRIYHGERFTSHAPLDPTEDPAAPAIPPEPDCGDAGVQSCELPRLVKNGIDLTPAEEPDPYRAIDRLVQVHLRGGVRGRVRVTLPGTCLGVMADIANRQTCVNEAGILANIPDSPLEADMSIPGPVAKSFGAPIPCPKTATPRPGSSPNGRKLFDEEVCVPGAGFLQGNVGGGSISDTAQTGFPVRVTTLPPFYMDKYEVTVARWRDAISRGFAVPGAGFLINDTPLGRDTCNPAKPSSPLWCTYTNGAGSPEDREDYPLNCVSWYAARTFCQFAGGDLPSEAQWEYVVRAAERQYRSAFPWGDDIPNCMPWVATDRAVERRLGECSANSWQSGYCLYTDYHGVLAPVVASHPMCGLGSSRSNMGFFQGCGGPPTPNSRQGPQPVDAVDTPTGDRSYSLGVVGLAGSVSEFMRDAYLPMNSQWWAAATMASPICDVKNLSHTVRGGAWSSSADVVSRSAPAKDAPTPQVGFRCVRPLQ